MRHQLIDSAPATKLRKTTACLFTFTTVPYFHSCMHACPRGMEPVATQRQELHSKLIMFEGSCSLQREGKQDGWLHIFQSWPAAACQ